MARSEILVGNSFIVDKDLQTLSSWFESNHLTVNRTKIQALSVGPCDYHHYLFLNNARIEFLQSDKLNCVKKPEKNSGLQRGFFTQLHKLRSLRRSFLHFHFISAVHI